MPVVTIVTTAGQALLVLGTPRHRRTVSSRVCDSGERKQEPREPVHRVVASADLRACTGVSGPGEDGGGDPWKSRGGASAGGSRQSLGARSGLVCSGQVAP